MASKVKQSRKGRKRSGKNEVVELVIQSENSEDATNSEELTLTQQKYIPVFGKPTRSTLKSQQDGNVEKSVKRPRIENSQLAEDLKLEHVINKEEVSETVEMTSENQSVKQVHSDMKDSSQEEDAMKRNNQSTVADETVNVNVCMIEVEKCELKEESYQEGVFHVQEAEGPEHCKEEGTSNEVAKERDCKEAQLGSLVHPQQDASCSDFEHSIKPMPEVSLNSDQNSKVDAEVVEADSGKEIAQRGTIDELQATLNCQREAKINVAIDSSSEGILKEEDLDRVETLLHSNSSDVKMEGMQKEDTCKFFCQAEEPTTNNMNENMDNSNKLNCLTTEAKKMKGIEDTVSQDLKLVTEMSKILCDTISGTKMSEVAATAELKDGLKGNNFQSDTEEVIQEKGQRSQGESAQNFNSNKIDGITDEGQNEIVVDPCRSGIPSKVSKDLSKEIGKDLKSKDERDIKYKGEQQQTNLHAPGPKLTDLVKFDDIECDKNDIWTDSQIDMLDEVITTTSISILPDTDMFQAVDLPVLVPQKTIDEYSSEGTLLMKGLIDELSSVTKNIVSIKHYIDSVKKQRQSRINVIWKNDKGNIN